MLLQGSILEIFFSGAVLFTQMAATERRVGLSRRGMTVLGKVPVAPKPINLPSQRLENQGLFPDVDIVPRGTCSWGHAGRFPGAGGNRSGNKDSASSNPISSVGEQEDTGSKPVASSGSKNSGVKDAGGLLESLIQSSSTDSLANPSLGGATITAQAFDSVRKMEEPRNSISHNCNASDSQKHETADPPLQKSGDYHIRGVSVPPGFGNCGPHGNHSRTGVFPSEFQCSGAGAGIYSDTSQENGLHTFPGMPYHSGKKDREIIVIHMVGNPGFYGNYPPQIGYPENYSRNGMYGNFPLQFGNFEPYFGLQGHGRLHGGTPISAATSSDLFDEHEDFICYEKECYKGACHDLMRQKNGWVHGSFTFLGGAQRDVHEALISGSTSALKSRAISQKHLPRNAGRLKSMYRNGRGVSVEASSAVPVPGKRITLLTKVSQREKLTNNNSLEGSGVCEVAHAQGPVGSVISDCWNKGVCEDEGKPPTDITEAGKVTEDAQAEKSAAAGAPDSLEMADEVDLSKETKMGSNEVSASTTTCVDKCLHSCPSRVVSPVPLSSSGGICVDDSRETLKKQPRSVASIDCVADMPFQKTEGKSIRNTTLHKDCHDNAAAVQAVESEESTLKVLEDTTSTESQKQGPKGAGSTNEQAWRPKLPTTLQSKSATKASGIRVSKAHVVRRRKLGLQGRKSHLAVSSNVSTHLEERSKEAKEQEDAVQRNDSLSTSQSCNAQVLKTNVRQSSEAPSKKNAGRQKNLLFRKRSAEEAALGQASSRNSSNPHIKSLIASPKADFGTDDSKQGCLSAPWCKKEASYSVSVSASKYHMIRRRVYHVVEGSGGDYYLPSIPEPDKLHQVGNQESHQTCSMQQMKHSHTKELPLSSGSSHGTESEHSEESVFLPDSMCGKEIKSSRSWSEGIAHLELAGVALSQHPARPLLPSSGVDDSGSRKQVKPGKRSSAWKPKVASETSGLENAVLKEESKRGTLTSCTSNQSIGSLRSSQAAASSNLHTEDSSGSTNDIGSRKQVKPIKRSTWKPKVASETSGLENAFLKEENEIGSSTCGASNESTGSLSRGQAAAFSNLHAEESNEEHAVRNLPLEPESVSFQPLEGDNHLLNQEDAFVSRENREALDMDTQELAEILVSKEEMKHVSVQKHFEEAPRSSDNSQERNRKPFIRKSHVMSFEKANRYHQLFFKKYKAVGQWKPKADLHNQSVKKGCASQGDTEARIFIKA